MSSGSIPPSTLLALLFDMHWLLLIDLASVHRSSELQLLEHVHIVFIPVGATGYLQPLDRAVFKAWKAV
eukprot:5600612-Amphidinium_carterae.1